MLSAKEKRFIRSWEEQRKGGKWKFFLLYIPTGTFIGFVVVAFLLSMTMISFISYLPWVAMASFLVVTLITIAGWMTSEKKFKEIIRREVREGQLKEQQSSGDE